MKDNHFKLHRKQFRMDKVAPYIFISPGLVLFFLFSLFPIFFSFYLSLTDWEGLKTGSFIALNNYIKLILRDGSFWTAFKNNVYLWIINVPLMTFGSLILAVLLNMKLKLRSFFRASLFLPVVVSMIVAGLIFLYLVDPQYGLISLIIGKFGLEMFNIKTNPYTAVPLINMVVLWRWTGFNTVIQLAGLQAIPTEIIESSIVEGATFWQRVRYIIIPMMRPIIVFAMMMSTIGTFNLFDESFILFGSEGGISQSGLLLATLLYRNAFLYFKLGYASAIAFVITIIIFIGTLIFYRYARTEY